MEHMIHTLQEFYTHTKAVTYIVMVVILIAVTAYWRFISARDENPIGKYDKEPHKH